METILFVRGNGSLENLMLLITNLGSENAYIVVLALYSWLVSPRMGRQLGLWFGINVALNTGLKMLFHTQRPFEIAPGLASVKAMATAGGGAMPSGHAQNAAFISGFLADKHPRTWLIAILMIVTLLIAIWNWFGHQCCCRTARDSRFESGGETDCGGGWFGHRVFRWDRCCPFSRRGGGIPDLERGF
jgi:PAP2 superfamily